MDTQNIVNLTSHTTLLPKIAVPKIFTESSDGGIEFKLNTSNGIVNCFGYGGYYKGGFGWWECTATEYALISAGLIQHEWCPGYSGNNMVQQIVAFDSNGAKLVFGNKKQKNNTRILIKRVSKTKLMVKVPASAEQIELLAAARKRCDEAAVMERRQALEKQYQTQNELNKKAVSRDEVRVDCLTIASNAQRLIEARIDSSLFVFDAGVKRDIEGLFTRLNTLLNQGVLRLLVNDKVGSNIIRLHS